MNKHRITCVKISSAMHHKSTLPKDQQDQLPKKKNKIEI
jgi:hypothetical protein